MGTNNLKNLKVALVHDWLVSEGGAERALYYFHELFPDAPIYTLVYDEEKAPEWTKACDIRTTYLQHWPGAKSHHKMLLQFMPRAWESLDLTGYDFVLSSCASCCKGVITRPDAVHVCYCHSPIRYVWDLYFEYLEGTDPLRRAVMKRVIPRIRMWDYLSAQRVDYFLSNSDYVGRRIKKFYRRDSETVFGASPINAKKIETPSGYYLVVSRFVHYKRVDLAIEACNRLGRRLVIVGSGGEEEQTLRNLAGPTVEFRGRVSDDEMAELYAHADAFLFTGIEDFGLTPLEAMGSGVPVLAYGEGGVTETVVDGQTGLFFHEQTVNSLSQCIVRFEHEGVALSRESIQSYSQKFSSNQFKSRVLSACARAAEEAGL